MSYSLAITGMSANQTDSVSELLTLSDAQATPGGMANAMQNGTQFLCKGPDGSQAFYRLDAERSTPSVPVLIAVGP